MRVSTAVDEEPTVRRMSGSAVVAGAVVAVVEEMGEIVENWHWAEVVLHLKNCCPSEEKKNCFELDCCC